jgi:hypothetical protein
VRWRAAVELVLRKAEMALLLAGILMAVLLRAAHTSLTPKPYRVIVSVMRST